MPVIVERYPDHAALIEAAARLTATEAAGAVQRLGVCRLALSGGDTPRALYEKLAEAPWVDAIPWSRTVWFFGDERWVPRDHPHNNSAMVERALLSRVPVPRHQIHPVPTDAASPSDGARAYEHLLRKEFSSGAWPGFDLVFMGLGTDGHTASLFPGDHALAERTAWVTATAAGDPVPDRVTLTIPVFTHARCMAFLVAGAAKADAVAATLDGPRDPHRWPAQAVTPSAGRCVWLLDDAAAARIADSSQRIAHRKNG